MSYPEHPLQVEFRSAYFEELQAHARLAAEEELRQREKARARFVSMLRHLRRLSADLPWERFVEEYKQEPEFKAVGAKGGLWNPAKMLS